jgi:hypothetical protein
MMTAPKSPRFPNEIMISQEVQDHLIRKEKDIYAAYKQHEMSVIDSALAADFREIDGSGRLFSKSEVLSSIMHSKKSSSCRSMRAMRLSPTLSP